MGMGGFDPSDDRTLTGTAEGSVGGQLPLSQHMGRYTVHAATDRHSSIAAVAMMTGGSRSTPTAHWLLLRIGGCGWPSSAIKSSPADHTPQRGSLRITVCVLKKCSRILMANCVFRFFLWLKILGDLTHAPRNTHFSTCPRHTPPPRTPQRSTSGRPKLSSLRSPEGL